MMVRTGPVDQGGHGRTCPDGRGPPFVLTMDADVVWTLSGLGVHGVRAIGGWGMLMMGVLLLPVVAANLLVLIALLYRTAMRRIESTSERA
jgi:hypothetical protein